MLSLFPTLQEEELLYGGVCRYQELGFHRDAKALNQEVFGSHRYRAIIDLPTNLLALTERLPKGHPEDLDTIINLHTQFPYYSRFMTAERRDQVRSDMVGDIATTAERFLGAAWCGCRRPSLLQFCSDCARVDRLRCGAPIWRRVHQLPGIAVCPSHGVFLRAVPGTRAANSDPKRYVPLQSNLMECSTVIQHDQRWQPALVRIAAETQWLLSNHDSSMNLDHVRCQLTKHVELRGWRHRSGKISAAHFVSALRHHFGDDLLAYLNCPLHDRAPDRTWLATLCRGKKSAEQPIRFLLVADMLGLTVSQFLYSSPHEDLPCKSSQTLASAGEFCANPACPSFISPVKECGRALLLDSPRWHALGCSQCGFTFMFNPACPGRGRIISTGRIWEAALRRYMAQGLDLQTVATQLAVAPITILRHADRLGIVRRRWKKSGQRSQSRRKAAIARNRRIWMRAPITMRRGRNPKLTGAYWFLRRYDRDWLLAHLSPHDFRADWRRGLKLRWRDREEDLIRRANAAEAEMKGEAARPKRITRMRLERALFGRPIKRSKLDKMPSLFGQLSKLVESKEEFAARRLAWAVHKFEDAGVLPTTSDLVKAASLELACYPSLRLHVRNAIAALTQKLTQSV